MIGKPFTDFAPVGVRPARRQGFNLIVGNTRVTGSHQLRRSTSAAAGAELAGVLVVGNIAGGGAAVAATPVSGAASELAIAKTGINARAVTTTTSTGRAKWNVKIIGNFNAAERLCGAAIITLIYGGSVFDSKKAISLS
jgi:hypothetical protein